MKALPRKEALEQGLSHYFTGKPCLRGHIAKRRTDNCACLECNNENVRKYQKRNPERAREATKKWRENNRERYLDSQRVGRGLPAPTRPDPKQCEICGKGQKTSYLDHCHETGKFRGWLCHRCNVGLGCFGDNLSGISAALDYMRRVS